MKNSKNIFDFGLDKGEKMGYNKRTLAKAADERTIGEKGIWAMMKWRKKALLR